MPTFDDARRLILSSVAPMRVERVCLLDAVGRVLPEEVVAPCNLPLCDNSAMDGYAVRAADCGGYAATGGLATGTGQRMAPRSPPPAAAGAGGQPVRLKITGYIPAGRLADHPLEPGCAFKIM